MPPLPRVPLSYQASACSLSTLHFLKFPYNNFEVLKLLENSMEVLKIMENKLKSVKILENKLESLKLQENQPVDGLVPLSIKKLHPKDHMDLRPASKFSSGKSLEMLRFKTWTWTTYYTYDLFLVCSELERNVMLQVLVELKDRADKSTHYDKK
nr:hypothetical protein [Tanacetum cinerariifolium]